jgi:hypothetical protein
LFPSPTGDYPALCAAGAPHRRIYDMRHTYATFSLAADVNLSTLARRVGTSVEMIDGTDGHLAPDTDTYESDLVDNWDARIRAMGAHRMRFHQRRTRERLRCSTN